MIAAHTVCIQALTKYKYELFLHIASVGVFSQLHKHLLTVNHRDLPTERHLLLSL